MRVALINPIRTAVVTAFAGILTAAPSQALEWQKEVVFEGAAKPSLAVGADGLPRVAFLLEAMPGFVTFAERRDSGWVAEQVATGYFYGPLDVLMNGANPVINYHDHDLQDQVVAVRGEGGWARTPIQSAGHDGWDNTLGIGPDGVLHTLTTDPLDFGGPGLEYASLIDGVWRVEEVGTGPIMYAEGLSMASPRTARRTSRTTTRRSDPCTMGRDETASGSSRGSIAAPRQGCSLR